MIRHRLTVTAILAPLLLAGCTGIEPAALGFGYNAVQTGVTYISGVDSYSYQPAIYEDVLSACKDAGSNMDLDAYAEREISETKYQIKYTFGPREVDRMVVTVTYATAVVTKVEVNVKEKENSGMSTLYMRVLTQQLLDREAYEPEFEEAVLQFGN